MKYKLKNNEPFEVIRDDRTVNILNVPENIIMEFTANAGNINTDTVYTLEPNLSRDDVEAHIRAGNNVVAIVPVAENTAVPVSLNLTYIPDGNGGWMAGPNIWGYSAWDKQAGIRVDWAYDSIDATATKVS